MQTLLDRVKLLNEIGIALSAERDSELLLEKILGNARSITRAESGTIYTVTPQNTLHFEIVQNDALEAPLSFPDIALPNDALIVAHSVHHKKTIHVHDVYEEKVFDFSGTRAYDKQTGYHTQSVLTVPIINHEGEVIAAIQLINSSDPATHETIPFTEEDIEIAESLASQAGVALTNQRLITDLRSLFEAFIKAIATAIDEKSPVTGNHGRRVPVVAEMLARAMKDHHFSEEEIYELKVAAYMHDCGKITTPVHIVEKQNRLEKIVDRIELIKTRFEVLKHENGQDYSDDIAFLERCNTNREAMTPDTLSRLKQIAGYSWTFEGKKRPMLTEDELKNLSIRAGNLTDEERNIIQNHVVMTRKMLEALPYPKELKNVPEIASAHHERVDGHGYPRGLKGNEMSVRARILAIADIFEALSAPDRPYKKPLPLSQIYTIMNEMAQTGHIDRDIWEVFLKENVGSRYARDFLAPEQLDVM